MGIVINTLYYGIFILSLLNMNVLNCSLIQHLNFELGLDDVFVPVTDDHQTQFKLWYEDLKWQETTVVPKIFGEPVEHIFVLMNNEKDGFSSVLIYFQNPEKVKEKMYSAYGSPDGSYETQLNLEDSSQAYSKTVWTIDHCDVFFSVDARLQLGVIRIADQAYAENLLESVK